MLGSKWLAGVGAAVLVAGTLVTAEQQQQQQAAAAVQQAPQRRQRLTQPWSQLKDLTDDQKTKIVDILGKAAEQVRAINAKRDADITALLSEDQKKQAAELQAQRRGRAGRGGAATRPAGAGR